MNAFAIAVIVLVQGAGVSEAAPNADEPTSRVYARTIERDGTPTVRQDLNYYAKWASTLPATVEATGEDAMFGLITFANGTLGQWVDHYAGHGESFGHRRVFGTTGTLEWHQEEPNKMIFRQNNKPHALYTRAGGARR